MVDLGTTLLMPLPYDLCGSMTQVVRCDPASLIGRGTYVPILPGLLPASAVAAPLDPAGAINAPAPPDPIGAING